MGGHMHTYTNVREQNNFKNQVHVGRRFKRVQQYCLAYESAQYYFRNAEKYCYLSQFYAKTVQKCIPGDDMNFIIKFLQVFENNQF